MAFYSHKVRSNDVEIRLADYQIKSNQLTEFNLMSPTTTAHDAI